MQTSPRNFTPMPSFGAVFGEEARNNHLKNSSDTDKTGPHGSLVRSVTSGNTHSGVPFSSFHIHRDSRDSTSTASSDNSPTTTISTMDSSTVTDPSPGPSPESPVAKTPSSSFVADFRSRRTENPSQDSSANTFFELARPTTPAKKPRNLKNLGINTSSSLGNLRTAQNATTLVVEKKEKNTSAPASPSFIKPPTPPKRRPSNLSLTISTPGSNDNKPMRLIIPSTPAGSRPTLRHFQSSPSLPLCSPSVGPSGGMKMPVLRHVPSKPSGLSEVPYEMEEEEDQEPNFDVPQSREEKPAAYPNGPIEIYPSGIFLYFEPTVEQACTFDVIINVASEVKNPFTTPVSEISKDLNARRIDGPAAENPDFAALPSRAGDSSSPPTPKAAPAMAVMQPGERVIDGKLYKTPEYIHMPWEHNTDIVADLYKLVKTMDDRVQQGKRVLVHCQCGVSRSASLIVAYGIYKNPETSVQETYDIVKKRSKWIGPNMSLIMQLQEYRNTLTKGADSRSYLGQPSFGRRSAGLPTGISTATNRHSPFDRDVSSAPRTPRTAPLPPDTDMNLQRASTGSMIMLSPGPLSAPSGSSVFSPGFRQSWAASQTQFDLSPKSSPKTTPYVDPAGHVVPMLAISNDDAQDKPQTPPIDETPSDREATLKPLFVPSFSRKLPFRTNDKSSAPERPRTSPAPSGLHVPPASLSLEPLRSPAVPTFNMPTFTPDSDDDLGLRSPIKASFNLSPWPSTHGYSTESSPTAERFPLSPFPPSLGSGEPYQSDLYVAPEASTGLFSPLASTFNVEHPPPGPGISSEHLPSDDDFEVTSPVRTEFPSDMFGPADNAKNDLTSPRAAEFHMTPLKPKEEDEDPFGLTSPTRFEFPSDLHKRTGLTPPRFTQPDFRRPSFQAILPPSHLAQPETSNGFASLDGTAQAPASVPSMILEQPKSPDSRIDSVGTLSEQSASSSTQELPSHGSSQVQPITPQAPFHSISNPTPPRQPGLRARFSSPNMRDQRKLHKLQTEMESMLPHRTPPRAQAFDDLHALMSPRAEEYTRNPFHFDLPVTADENSSASSLETVKEGQTRSEWTEKRQWTPQKSLDDDPRSPVQGSSPIVRNIWDVL